MKNIIYSSLLVLFCVVGLYFLTKDIALYFTGVKASATVTRVTYVSRSSNGPDIVTFNFSDSSGQSRTVDIAGRGLRPQFIVGNQHDIVYDPDNINRIVVSSYFIFVYPLFASLILAFACLILVTSLRRKSKPKR